MRARGVVCRRPLSARDLAGDHAEQGGLAGAVAADQPDPRAVRNVRARTFDQQPAGHAYRELVDHEHRGVMAECGPEGHGETAGVAAARALRWDAPGRAIAQQS